MASSSTASTAVDLYRDRLARAADARRLIDELIRSATADAGIGNVALPRQAALPLTAGERGLCRRLLGAHGQTEPPPAYVDAWSAFVRLPIAVAPRPAGGFEAATTVELLECWGFLGCQQGWVRGAFARGAGPDEHTARLRAVIASYAEAANPHEAARRPIEVRRVAERLLPLIG